MKSMGMDKIGEIYQEYLPRYKSKISQFQPDKLKQLIQKAIEEARLNYDKLTNPKTLSLQTYVFGWVREVVDQDFTKLRLKEKADYPDRFSGYHSIGRVLLGYLSSTKYFEQIVLNPTSDQKIYSGSIEERSKKWSSLKLPVKKIERRFKELVKTKTQLAKDDGYSNYVEVRLNQYKISKRIYSDFLENIDKAIDYCNQNLPQDSDLPDWFYAKFNLPCFICRMKTFPFESLDQVFNFVAKHYPILDKYKEKIQIEFTTEGPPNIRYIKEMDHFRIILNKNDNLRHQSISLVHELSHTVSFLQDFKRNIDWVEPGKYQDEKEAYQIEFKFLQKASVDLYQARLGDILLTFRRVLFEIEIYNQPEQDLAKLYAQTFNRCFKQAKQIANLLYVIDEGIVMRPLSNLSHAIACENVLSKRLSDVI